MFSPKSFSSSSFGSSWLGVVKEIIEQTVQIVFGGSGWNFDPEEKTVRGRDKFGEDILIEDDEIIEFLTVFALWRGMQM